MNRDDFTNLSAGDRVTLDDRHELRIVVEPDYCATVNDYDCYGQVAEVETNRDYWGGYGVYRPDGFDGAARKIHTQGDAWWWQPPADLKNATGEELRRLECLVRDLIEYGFSVVGVQLWEKVADSRGGEHWVELDAQYIGGIDSLDDLGDIAWELAGELEGVDA